MIDSFMASEFRPNLGIPGGLIRHHRSLAGYIGAQDRAKGSDGGSFDMETSRRADALDKGKDNVTKAAPPARHSLGRAVDLTGKSFVHLYGGASAAHRLNADNAHGF